ncbi:MAG: lamin tail domain-containing protein [Proteobacteria bacterium]|nr:lamin tail domain-containing protein [Pseudomonadota bacterium]MCP4918449.1 lamin tail domain-containing protein [Pseudomonadota bacterium]
MTDLVEGDLIITEIMQNPSQVDDQYGEWFELFNNAGGTVDLDGLYVYDLGSNDFTVSGELLVEDGEFVVFGNDDDTSANGDVDVDYDYSAGSMSLGNSDDELYLAESSSMATVIDSVEWDSGATFPDPTGASTSLDPSTYDDSDNDDGENWCEATSTFGDGDCGTPGSDDDSCPVETTEYGDGYDASGNYGIHGANYLLGQKLTLSSAITLTGFGMRTYTSSATCQVALYTDSSGPATLVAQSGGDTFSTGDTEVSLSGSDVALTAGDYWLMKVCSESYYMTEDTSSTSTTHYQHLSYGSTLPSSYSSSYTDHLMAAWLVGY